MKIKERNEKGRIVSRLEIIRFFEKVKKSRGCWQWLGKKDSYGYGKIFDKRNRAKKAHRLSFEIHLGLVGRKFVLHKCDNPSCVNPSHLYLGTQKDNIMDEVKRKRNRFLFRGSLHPNARFSKSDILGIFSLRRQGETQRSIAMAMNCSQQLISKILSRKRYA